MEELISLFESLEDIEKLQGFFVIGKALILFGDKNLLLTLMNDNFYEAIFGFLEYDPGIDITNSEYRYRKFFRNKAQFLNVVQIKNLDVLKKIQLNYRLIFLRDTAASSWLEDSVLLVLSDVLFYFTIRSSLPILKTY